MCSWSLSRNHLPAGVHRAMNKPANCFLNPAAGNRWSRPFPKLHVQLLFIYCNYFSNKICFLVIIYMTVQSHKKYNSQKELCILFISLAVVGPAGRAGAGRSRK